MFFKTYVGTNNGSVQVVKDLNSFKHVVRCLILVLMRMGKIWLGEENSVARTNFSMKINHC